MSRRGYRDLSLVGRRPEPRCYTIAQIIEKIPMSRRTFFDLRARGEMPFLDPLPSLGRLVRYRAEPIDAWIDNRFNRTRSA